MKLLKINVCVPSRLYYQARCERHFVVKNDVGQGITIVMILCSTSLVALKLSIESQSASKLLILPGKCSVAIKVFQFPKLVIENTKNTNRK